MKKIFRLLSLIILFSVIYFGCRKDNTVSTPMFTPYNDVINPPDTFIYYFPLSYNSTLQDKVRFKQDGVWHITKTSGMSANTWLMRTDKTTTFNIPFEDTVALQGNLPYYFVASNATSTDGEKIYFQFIRIKTDYQSFNPKY